MNGRRRLGRYAPRGLSGKNPGKSTMTLAPAPGERTGTEPGERVLGSDREIAWSDGGGSGGRALLQRLQREPDGGVDLGIAARGPVVRRDCHLDVRIHAVVLHRPADVGEPQGGRRLCHQGPVDQLVEVTADHAAPGPGADYGR